MEKKLTREKKIRQSMIFNTIGSLVYYACQWLMTILVARMSGYVEAGIFSIAMSVTASPAIVGLFNVRSFQVSDVENQFSNEIYIQSRLYTITLSFIICIVMVLLGGYDIEKTIDILVYMIYKITEGIADVYYGVEQKKERMDYAGISLAIRGIGTVIAFGLILETTNSLLLSLIAISIVSFSVILLYDRRIVKKWEKCVGEKIDNGKVIELLRICFPLAIVAFLNNLSLNIPRIYLEKYYGAEVMGFYASVSSPTLVVPLAATTILAPLIPELALLFKEKKKPLFFDTIKKLLVMVVILSVICLVGAAIFGHWGLVMLFTESIEPYTYLFVPIIGTAILIAVNTSLFSICTLMREIKSQYFVGVIGIIMSYFLSITLVRKFSMMGVVYALIGAVVAQIVVQLIIICKKIRMEFAGDLTN